MNKGIVIRSLIMVLIANLVAVCAYAALDYPHFGINNIGCDSCHFVYGSQPSLLPEWTAHTPVDIDDTQFNTLCWSCHNDIDAPYARTHSSLQTDNGYGDWTVECRVCHNPHSQRQFRAYGSPSYIYSDSSTGITSSTITKSGAGWMINAYQGLVVVPNVSQKNYNYKILSNTEETLTVQGPIDLTRVTVGNVFAVVYGKLIKDVIELDDIINPIPPKTGNKTTRFFNATGPNSFADGDAAYDGVCEVCHTQTTHYRNDGNGPDQLHTNMGTPSGTNCTNCHKHANGFRGMGGGAHPTHVIDVNGPQVGCYDCHQTGNIPFFKSGTDSNGDGKYELSETDVCNNCHSSNGVSTAKTYWIDDPGTWPSTDGEASFCGSCHDETPGNSVGDGSGDPAPNIAGNNSTYGFYVTGHGKTSGYYARLSWQDTTATGNPAANRQCSACHDLASRHFNNAADRLKAGYENDNNNSNCKQCHDPGTIAIANPQWYTTYAEYEGSAHKVLGNLKCTACHNVHGSSGPYAGMTKNNKENLCNQCHTGHGGHDLGVSFGKNNSTYSLECVSCHNVHIVTGVTSATNPGIAAMSMFTDNLQVWGDEANEKIRVFAGSGTYRTPKEDTLNDLQMPDYPTFCLDCHGTPQAEFGLHGGITWGDNHGLASANVPNGSGVCPDWFACGLAGEWDGDDCTAADKNDCWPVMSRSKGDELFSRPVYNHEERISGANFVLSCSDCHETHKPDYQKLRSTVNGSTYTGEWKTLCNSCHYYYSDWHAGMSCGWYNSCHNDPGRNPRAQGEFGGLSGQTIHGMPHGSGDGSTRTFNPDLVVDMRFENNLNDSGTWRMHGKWYSASGSFAAGKSGQAAVLGEDVGVQVGTRNSYWSTDEGKHGTWKYTDMKFNTSLEAWVYPTDNAKSEYTIFNKHVGVSNNGGYAFSLQKISGALRAAFTVSADNNGVTQDGRAGIRGAYSSVAVPLNKWTHVAATFDTNGPDGNPSDLSIGRIRIYVNGEDVTTSDTSGNNSQPGAGETSIFNYSENSPWNEGICYNGTWCASEFSIGGFDWETTNFIGRIDEAKVWNVTKDAAYFAPLDSQTAPYISEVKGLMGNNQLTATFSEGVYTDAGSSGAVEVSDFTLSDTGGNNPRTITGVTHTAGSSTATITMSQPLTASDVNSDTLAAASLSSIYDDNNNAMGTETVTIGLSSQCPAAPVSIQLNGPSGSSYIMDTQGILYGAISGGPSAFPGDGYLHGDGLNAYYIDFSYNTACLLASTSMTLETRIKPIGLSGTSTYLRRVIERNAGNANYQLSIWRNNGIAGFNYNAPSGEASIALWVAVADSHGGDTWKPVLTNYTGAANGPENNCPIVSDHWYQVKAVWNTNKPGGTPGQFFQPVDIYVDDQGTDGDDAGETWAGYINCTDADQSLKGDIKKFYTNDRINTAAGLFRIGSSVSGGNLFYGLIDWITWKDTVD